MVGQISSGKGRADEMNYRHVFTILVAAWCLLQSASASAKNSHVVSQGDTLWAISRSYGCAIKAIRQVNQLGGGHLNVGQELQIPTCEDERVAVVGEDLAHEPTPTITHTTMAGDTLGHLAARYRSSVSDILERNRLTSTTILVGQRLLIVPNASVTQEIKMPMAHDLRPLATMGQSIGLPHRGRLKKAVRLSQGKGYYIRRPHRSYGASHTVSHLEGTLASLRQRFPKLHDLAIGDISAERGGKITMHASHQSGRDVDIGFYFKSKPEGYPESFVVANHKNLHFAASWALLTQFTDLAKKPSGVDKIFMSYESQKLFYKLARKHGVAKAKLKRMFQYPAGKGAATGIIRHEPGHDEHFHVRFKCPPKDKSCL